MKSLLTVAGLLAVIGAGAWTEVTSPHATFPEGPPLAHTGGFGEPTCAACHFDGDTNDAAGTLTLSGVPERYEPGRSYRVVVSLERPELVRGGFELAARFSAGKKVGHQAGALRASSERVTIQKPSSGDVQYAYQTLAGSLPNTDRRALWELDWEAPASGAGPVVFHVAANAGNGDESQFGDWIYSDSLITRPGPPE